MMNTAQPVEPKVSVSGEAQGSGSARLADYVREILAQGGSDAAVWRCLVDHVRGRWESPYAAARLVTVRGMTHEESVSVVTRSSIWAALVNAELTQAVVKGEASSRTFRDSKSGVAVSIHTVPVRDADGNACGALGVVTDALNDVMGASAREQLATYVELLHEAGWDTEHAIEQNDFLASTATEANGDAIDLLSATLAGRFKTLEELAFSLTNSLKTRFGCIEVALGQVRRGRVKLLAISGMDTVHRRTPGAFRVTQAMEECLDQGGVVYAQTNKVGEGEDKSVSLPIHARWRAVTQGSSCISISLGAREDKLAVVSLRRSGDRPFTDEEVTQVRTQLGAVGDAIDLLSLARRGLFSHLMDASSQISQLLIGQGAFRRMLIASTVMVVAGALVWPWNYRVTVDARLNSADGRIYAAPSDGRLAKVLVRPGEEVMAGQLLFEMDTQELSTEIEKLRARITMHRVRMVEALREKSAAGAAAEREQLESVTAELATAERQLADSRVFAQDRGVVTRGEGHWRTGERIPFGTPVVQVTGGKGSEVELRIEDHLASDLNPGMRGWFAGQGEPDRPRSLTITRLERRAEVEEGRNLLSVWAELDEAAMDLPLGAEGFAQVHAGRKPGWWILFHKPIRSLRWHLMPL